MYEVKKSYYQNGSLYSETPYKNDKIHGKVRYYEKSIGSLTGIDKYKNGYLTKIIEFP